MYTLLAYFNEYDQYGGYLVAVWKDHPTLKQIKEASKEYGEPYKFGKCNLNYTYKCVKLIKLEEGEVIQARYNRHEEVRPLEGKEVR